MLSKEKCKPFLGLKVVVHCFIYLNSIFPPKELIMEKSVSICKLYFFLPGVVLDLQAFACRLCPN